ncbi:MAG TPA: hypothetical protein DHV67_05285 [Gallionella sp.]|nr:hypothetical protein [Gallionella sp.]
MNQRLIRILGGSTEHYPYALESKYPRILEQIMSLWDSDEIDHCFMDLMVTNRGDRVGFPPEVAAEIMYLSLVHAAQESPDKNKDIWDASSNLFVNFTPHATLENSWPAPPADIRDELKKLGFYVTLEGFFDAIEENNRAAVALFIQVPISTEIRDNRGWTPLMLAAFLGNIEITELLIKSSADINALDLGGNSALHWAVFGCHTACTRILIEHHARTDTRNNFGWTPLMQATARNNLEGAALLIASGVNLDTAANDGMTALHKAAASGYLELVELLLEQGADRKLKTYAGLTPMELAVNNKHERVIQVLAF